jgi:glycosyltransferase involved in cell wall biosynthesis
MLSIATIAVVSASLSVIVPVRNVEAYFADLLLALERNLDPDFELIIVDDGSTDGTPGLIETFVDRLPGLQVLRHESAVGLADARNAGLEVARGRYVTFLDGDDWIAPDYLRRLVAAIVDLGADFVRVDHVQVQGRDRTLHRAPEARRGVLLDPRSGILPVNRKTMVDYPYAWAGVYRRDLPGLPFPPALHTAEDRPWIWRLHREAATYAVVTLAGVFYRRLVADSLTQIGDARQLHFLDAFSMVLAQVVDEPAEQGKAVRQFLAVLAHHLSTRARFAPVLQRRMRERAREVLGGIPSEVLRAGLPRDARADLLRPLMPAALRRPGRIAS